MNQGEPVTLTTGQAHELTAVLAALLHWLIFGASAAHADLTRSLRAHGLYYGGLFDTGDPFDDFLNLVDAYHAILDPD